MVSVNDQPRGSNILPLESNYRRTQQIDRVERYWNKVRGNRLVPSRSEIDPRGLEGVLSNAFILERIAGGLARFRIAGAHLTELTGLELRQMPVSALFVPASREILTEALQAAFDEPAMIRMGITSPSGFGRERLDGELILLPLRSDLGDIDRILGGLVFDGKIGRTPRRIKVVSQSRKALVGFAGPRDVDSGIGRKPLSVPKPHREQTFGRHRTSNGRATGIIERAHLRLVVSNA